MLTTNRALVLWLKTALVGFATSPWTVVSSSNGVTAGAGDSWTTEADLVWANPGTAHSWICLAHPAGFQVVFDLSTEAGHAAGSSRRFYVSPSAGFSGGSITACPTAADAYGYAVGYWSAAQQNNVRTVWHVSHSSAGTRIVAHYNNAHAATYVFDSLADTVAGLSSPTVLLATILAGQQAYSFLGSDFVYHRQGAITYQGRLTSEGIRSQDLAEYLGGYPNDIDNTWPLYPLGFASNTAGVRGRHGRLVDLWLGSSAIAEGSMYPGDGSRQFAQFSGFVFPWNGTLPIIA